MTTISFVYAVFDMFFVDAESKWRVGIRPHNQYHISLSSSSHRLNFAFFCVFLSNLCVGAEFVDFWSFDYTGYS